MNTEKYTKRIYNKFGKQYQDTRDKKSINRVYYEYLELPNMIKAAGKIKNKKLLDIECGARIHIKKYLKKGAIVSGLDISRTMLDLAKERVPSVQFKLGSINKIPFDSSYFDIITASLIIDYINNLDKAFKEVARVLKKGGLFYYSNESMFSTARGFYEDKNVFVRGIGHYKNKKTGKIVFFGDAFQEGLVKWDMLPGMDMYTYHKTFRTQLKSLINAGFELIDLIDCKPTYEFKKRNLIQHERFSKLPLFAIFVARKK